jgi:diguanylate cyclase (GGDEF)-like protein
MDKPLSIRQKTNSARTMTLTYVISLGLIASLSIFVYFSLDQIMHEQVDSANPTSVNGSQIEQIEMSNEQKSNDLQNAQLLILIIFILSTLTISIFVIRTLITQSEQNTKEPQQDANHDYLTNLLNRRSFNVLAEQSVAISKRYKYDLSVISFDIDHFKSINQQYGQELGDQVIQNVANTIQTNCRDSDSIFRFDGEAFLLLLPQTSLTEAIKLADKIRNKIASAPTFSDKLIVEITASGGVAQWETQELNIENTLKRADFGLAQAKEQGRDRIISSS